MPFLEFSSWLKLPISLTAPLTQGQPTVSIPKYQTIFYQGRTPDAVYVVVNGRVCIKSYSSSGLEHQLYIAEQGALFGERSCLLGTPHVTSAEAIVDTTLFTIPLEVFLERIHQDIDASTALSYIQCKKESMMMASLLSQSSSEALQKTARVLLNMVEQYGVSVPDGIKISIRFSQQDIANLIHTSRVTVSKIFRQLFQKKIIYRDANYIVITQLDTLKALASSEDSNWPSV